MELGARFSNTLIRISNLFSNLKLEALSGCLNLKEKVHNFN